MIEWLLTNALAALALACLAGVLIWTFRPGPVVRHALWLVVVLKLVAPGGPAVSLPIAVPPAKEEKAVARAQTEDMVVDEERFEVFVEAKPGQTAEEAAALAIRKPQSDEATDARGPTVAPVAAAGPPARPIDYRPWLLSAWLLGAVVVGGRQLRETVRFARFARQARPAPESLVAEVAAVAGRLSVRAPAVRALAGLTSPVLWCLGRPVLLWPVGLECRLKGDGRRAVIAHELAHLRRRDHWVRRLEMVASVLHWWNPLFWVARAKLRADAELACDAWAAGQADRRAYAEALLEVCSFNPRRRPAPVVGVFGEGRRAMQERLTMIMRDHVPCRLAFGAKLVVALMAVAAVPAWTLGQQAKPEAGTNDRQFYWVEVTDKADSDDAQAKEIENQIKALAQKLAALKAAKAAEAEKKGAEKAKEAQEKLGEKMKELHLRLSKDGQFLAVPQGAEWAGVRVLVAGKDGVKVVGPDGKEIKDVKVIIGGQPAASPQPKAPGDVYKYWVESHQAGQPLRVQVSPEHVERTMTARTLPAGGQAGVSITLSRATYKLNKDQAAALGTLLGSIKATVMETKVDGDSITVTTTPDAQQAIGQIVGLVQGKAGNIQYRARVAQPGVPPTPAVPAPPAVKPPAPVSPPKPGAPAGPEKINVNVILDQLKAAGAGADKVDIQAIVEKALKEAGVEKGNVDMAKLHELLKSAKPLEFKLKGEKADGDKKPDAEKK